MLTIPSVITSSARRAAQGAKGGYESHSTTLLLTEAKGQATNRCNLHRLQRLGHAAGGGIGDGSPSERRAEHPARMAPRDGLAAAGRYRRVGRCFTKSPPPPHCRRKTHN